MKNRIALYTAIVIVIVYNIYSCTKPAVATELVHQTVEKHIRQFQDHLTDTLLLYVDNDVPADTLRKAFLRSRMLFKQFEWAAEYFMPTTSRFVNGAPVPEIENEENKIMEPEGLQVIEGLLYPEYNTADSAELRRQVRLLMGHSKRYQAYWRANPVDSSQVFDAVKMEVFRIISLGISGYDNAIAQNSIAEAKAALQGCRQVIDHFGEHKQLQSAFDDAITYLSVSQNFESFDRLEFIRNYANTITKRLTTFQRQLNIAFVNDNRLLRPSTQTLFDEDGFNLNAYVADKSLYFTEAKAELGKKLFYDAILSSNSTRSCASCHNPSKAFTDGLPKSLAVTTGSVKRNAPTLLNAALQPWQFYDMRATNLENQAQQVISHKDEMHGDLKLAVTKLKKDTVYATMFKKAYNGQAITEMHIQNALASYVRSLTALNSRFDQYIRNENSAQLSSEEKNGFNIFMGKAKCGTCHFLPLFNGTLPPSFTKMDSEVLGVPATKQANRLDADSGRYLMYRLQPYLHSFKTTTVRNAALTAPYMHNGVFETLQEVVEFYNNGGGVGLKLNVPTQTLPPDSLKLTAKEKQSLIAFIRSLNSSSIASR